MELIDKAAVVAEIERRISEVSQFKKASYEVGLFDAYKNILSFLDTLETKGVDFEKEHKDMDEKIRQYLLWLVKPLWEDAIDNVGLKKDDIIAWLEKQGEQRSKLVDFDYNAKDSDLQEVTYFIPNGFHAEIDGNKVVIKQGEQKSAVNFRAEDWCVSKVDGKIHNIYNSEVGPKFKVGDWITNGEYTWFIEGMHNRFYDIISPEGCGTDDTIIHVDGHFHLWTIGDAKDGDVLASKNGDNILIFRNLDTNTSFSSYYNIAGIGELGWSNNRFIPATKEQRDQLEKAMTDAGYTFDFEKKELRKIEQKPDWSEEDEKIALSIEHVMNCASLLNIVPEKVDKIRTWIKSLKQRMGGEE